MTITKERVGESNRQVARKFEDIINNRDMDLFDEIVDDGFIDHTPPPGMGGSKQDFKQLIQAYLAAFPNLHWRVQHSIAEGDMVAEFGTGSGTMQEEFMGMKPTGKHATWDEAHLARFRNGKMVEHWGIPDQLGMMQQLGLMPEPASS